jgi:hypothetical protein
MHYKLLGFSQTGVLRTFWFHRIGPLGTVPVAFRVLADTSIVRKHNIPLQELPSLCSRVLNATSGNGPAGTLIVGEPDISRYAAELHQARAEAEAARQRRALQCSHLKKPAVVTQDVDSSHGAMLNVKTLKRPLWKPRPN